MCDVHTSAKKSHRALVFVSLSLYNYYGVGLLRSTTHTHITSSQTADGMKENWVWYPRQWAKVGPRFNDFVNRSETMFYKSYKMLLIENNIINFTRKNILKCLSTHYQPKNRKKIPHGEMYERVAENPITVNEIHSFVSSSARLSCEKWHDFAKWNYLPVKCGLFFFANHWLCNTTWSLNKTKLRKK